MTLPIEAGHTVSLPSLPSAISFGKMEKQGTNTKAPCSISTFARRKLLFGCFFFIVSWDCWQWWWWCLVSAEKRENCREGIMILKLVVGLAQTWSADLAPFATMVVPSAMLVGSAVNLENAANPSAFPCFVRRGESTCWEGKFKVVFSCAHTLFSFFLFQSNVLWASCLSNCMQGAQGVQASQDRGKLLWFCMCLIIEEQENTVK